MIYLRKPGRFSTSKSLPGRATWGKRDGGHDFLCALAALAALAIKYGRRRRREIIMVSSYPGFITIKVRWSFTNSNEDMNLSKTWVNLDKLLVIYSWVAFGFPLSDTNNQQLKIKLAGGLELSLCFPSYWECHNPNWRTPWFFREVGSTTTQKCVLRTVWFCLQCLCFSDNQMQQEMGIWLHYRQLSFISYMNSLHGWHITGMGHNPLLSHLVGITMH